ncbi:MAG: terminase small subunit [Chamaesiphon sp.]
MFCKEYLKDLNATQAAVRSGYSEKNADKIGSELLGKTRVNARIQELLNARGKRLEITADKVLKDIEECRLRCMQGEPVLDREGNQTGVWKFEASAALKASELQGKHLKLFTEKVEHSGSIDLKSMSDEELDRRYQSAIERASGGDKK